MEYKVNDIVEMKKAHPCSPTSKFWKLLEVSGDIKMQCCTCGYIVIMKRWDFDKKIVRVVKE